MNRRKPGPRPAGKKPFGDRRPNRKPDGRGPSRGPRSRPAGAGAQALNIVERKGKWPASPSAGQTNAPAGPFVPAPFRVLIAIHRPRYRGRADRAAALEGWEVVSLLNKQDPVGIVARLPGPPDILLISGDFGRQRDYAIFRAVQAGRAQGMTLVGLVEDCATPPEGFPDSAPNQLCDICLEPPYKTADLRALLTRLYTEKRGRAAPPPKNAAADGGGEEEGDEG